MTARPLRHAVRRDLPSIADLRRIVPDDGRWPEFGRAWMTFVVERTFERGHTYVTDPVDAAVAWIPTRPDLRRAQVADGRAGAGEWPLSRAR